MVKGSQTHQNDIQLQPDHRNLWMGMEMLLHAELKAGPSLVKMQGFEVILNDL